MCHVVPAKVIELKEDQTATVELDGLKKDIAVDFIPEAKLGDYVIVHAGYALSILDEDETEKTLSLIKDLS